MRKQPWSDKRERQYEHIRDDLEQRGRSEDTAEEIAECTVNKERAQAGEAKEASGDLEAGQVRVQARGASTRTRAPGADARRALRGCQAPRHRRPLDDGQGRARARRLPRGAEGLSRTETATDGGAESSNAGAPRALRVSHSHLFQGARLRWADGLGDAADSPQGWWWSTPMAPSPPPCWARS